MESEKVQTLVEEIPPMIEPLLEEEQSPIFLPVKRLFDLFIVLVLLPFALLIMLLFALLIKLETRGPVFYIQERSGQDGKCFKLFKLRSMGNDAEKDGATWAVANDPRVTKVGNFIRKTRIDELPQLLNVLKGEMSMIGPRPERPIFTEEFAETIPNFKDRLSVKPGLTGLAQVNGGYELSPKDKLRLDLYYIKNKGFKLDIFIIIRTITVVFTGDGAR